MPSIKTVVLDCGMPLSVSQPIEKEMPCLSAILSNGLLVDWETVSSCSNGLEVVSSLIGVSQVVGAEELDSLLSS